MSDKSESKENALELRRRAELKLRGDEAPSEGVQGDIGAQQLLHELEIHQVELEMQNAELQQARDSMASMLEKYMNLYDFAPVGYLSLDVSGRITDINLTGAALFEVERSQMLERSLAEFVEGSSQAVYQKFLRDVFQVGGKHILELPVMTDTGEMRWMDAQAICLSAVGGRQLCRLALSDITKLKRADAAKKRMDLLIHANRELEEEIIQRRSAEKALRASEQRQSALLKESEHMQNQLRQLSHGILKAQEAERRRISIELHDEITQTLVGINIELGGLLNELFATDEYPREKIMGIQELVEKSIAGIHRFAMELRPTLLDDLGLVSALKAHIREFERRSNLPVEFTYCSQLEALSNSYRTVLFRVTQAALSNIIQHAQASKVLINIQKYNERLHLDIHDNGKSFDVSAVLKQKPDQRMGLTAMRERVEIVGGIFQVLSSPENGTTVSVALPMVAESESSNEV